MQSKDNAQAGIKVFKGSDNAHLEWLGILAHLYIQQKHYDKAIILLKAKLAVNQQDKNTLSALSVTYLKDKQYQLALITSDQLLGLLVDNHHVLFASIWQVRAQAHQCLGDTDLAKNALTQFSQWRNNHEK